MDFDNVMDFETLYVRCERTLYKAKQSSPNNWNDYEGITNKKMEHTLAPHNADYTEKRYWSGDWSEPDHTIRHFYREHNCVIARN